MVKTSRPIPRDVYLRRRLFERLDRMRRFPVIWITAPAGSGKTTLASSFIGSRDIPCLWYQLDLCDADPATFFYFMGEAAKKAASENHLSLPLLTPEYIQGVPTFVTRYFEQLYARLGVPFFVVFDNYQEIPANAPFHDIMARALSLIPDGINAMVISRNELPSAFSRLKADRAIGFLQWEDMRFTESEASGTLRCWNRVPPPKETIRRLYELSDGWAAGLVLLHEASRKNAFPPAFSGKQIFDDVFDYFAAELFRKLNDESREFFLTTAFFPKMTVQMAEEMTGRRAAGRILQVLNRNNSFVMQHIDAGTTYEVHPLCRRFLLNLAETQFPPDQLVSIRKKAAIILDQSEMTDEAIGLLKEISAWDLIADIIHTRAPGMLKQGRHHSLQTWLESLPGAVVERSPWLLFWDGSSRMAFSPALATPIFVKAFEGFRKSGDQTGAMLAASGVITAIAYAFDDFSPLDHWYRILNDLAPRTGEFPNEELEAWVVSSLVIAAVLREIFSPETDFWERRALDMAETPATLATKAHAIRFILWRRLLWRGCHEALPMLQELERLSRVEGAPPLISISVQSARVQYHLFTGQHDELLDAAGKGLALSRETGIHMEDMWFLLHTVVSFASRLQDKEAQAWLERISSPMDRLPNWGKSLYHLQSMRIALIRRENEQALFEGKKAFDLSVKTGCAIAISSTNLLLAQLHLSTGDLKSASKHVAQARAYTKADHPNQGIVEVLKNEALLAFRMGEESRGMGLLEKALALSRQCGYFCNSFDNPLLTTALCEKALEEEIEVDHVRAIIRRRGLIPRTSPIHIENWPWALKIFTLGRFTIVRNGVPLTFSGKAQQMPLRLLKLLIALGGRGVSESLLSEFLWPDADGDLAHRSFGTTLHRLRKLVGYPEALRLSDSRLTLDNRLCWVDTWAFERLASRADEYEKQGIPEKAWQMLEKALSLYRRDFLAGEAQEPWVISTSERLKSKYFRYLLWLGNALETAKQCRRAVLLYERGLEINDCMEEVYQRLMGAYDCLGEKGEALAAYRRCRKVLATTLGVVPSPETEAIRDALLSPQRPLKILKPHDSESA